MRHRSFAYKKFWPLLIQAYGDSCFYCHEEPATCIDHVIPVSWDQIDTPENLVPSCALCNCIAYNKIFEDVESKRQYILNRRKSRKLRRAICVDCRLPFAYREHSPSLFLCAKCYDEEYGTNLCSRLAWKAWLETLKETGIEPGAYFAAKTAISKRDPRWKEKFAKFIVGYIVSMEDQQNET